MLRLVLGNLNYSSWSIRAWLVLSLAEVEFATLDVGIFTKSDWKDRILSFSGAGKVPILIDGNLTVHESLAIAETIAERCPERNLWPKDPALRARGRALSAEMVSSFGQLRTLMPVNLRGHAKHTPQSPDLDAETSRVFDIVAASMATTSGDFLLGDFGIVDCMYMPLLSRFRTYGVSLPPPVQRYKEAVFSHPLVSALERVAAKTEAIPKYDELLEK